jgi:hypothetical protein
MADIFLFSDLPKEFWGPSMSDKEADEIFTTSMLNSKMCGRLWAMLGRIDQPPEQLIVCIKEQDLDNLIHREPKC